MNFSKRFQLKYIYWVIGLILLSLLGAFSVLAFSPELQRAFLTKAIGAFTQECKMDYAHITFNSVNLKNLYILADKGSIGFKSFDLNTPLLKLLTKDEININDLSINELKINTAVNEKTSAPLLPNNQKETYTDTIQLPNKISLKQLNIQSLKIDGGCYFENDKILSFNLNASNITPTTEGQFELQATLKENDRQTANATLKGTIQQELIEQKRTWNVQLNGNGSGKTGISGLKGPFSNLGFNFRLNTQIHPTWIKSPLFQFKISTGNNRKFIEINLLQNITIPVNGDLTQINTLKGKILAFEIQPTPLKLFTPFIPNDFDIDGQLENLKIILEAQNGTFSAKTQKPFIIKTLNINYKEAPWIKNWNITHNLVLSATPKIKKQGPINLKQVVFEEGSLVIDEGENLPLLSLNLLNPLNLPINGQLSALLKGTGTLLNINLKRLPLSLANPFLDNTQLAGEMNGLEGTLELNEEKLIWKSITPLNFKNLTLIQNETPMIENLNGWLRPEFEGTFESFKTGIESFSLRNFEDNPWGTGAIHTQAHLTSKGHIDSIDIQGYLNASLAACFNQPGLKPYNQFASGESSLSLGITGNPNDKINFKITQALKNIHLKNSKNDADALTTLTINAEGIYTDEKLQLTTTTDYDSQFGPSDLVCIVNFDKKWNIQIKSHRLQLDPLYVFKPTPSENKAPANITPENTATETKPLPDQTSFWAGLPPVQIQCELQQIAQQKTAIAENIIGRFQVNPEWIYLETLTGTLLKSPFNLESKITFKPQTKLPYDANAKGYIKNLNMAELIALQSNKKTSPIEGFFDGEFLATGTGDNYMNLLNNIKGYCTFQSKQGVLHVLESAGAPAQVGAIAIGIAGALLGQKTPPSVQVANDLIKTLKTIEYDECLFKAERSDDLNIQLSECLIKGPTLRLTGKGQITHQIDIPIAEQPLFITAQMDGAGQAAQLMQNLRLADIRKKDATGYVAGPQFSIKGTLSNPDFSELYGLITKAGSNLVLTPKEAPKDNNTTLSPDKLLRGIFGG